MKVAITKVTLTTPLTIDLEQLRAGVYVHPNLAVKLGQVKDNPLATSLFFKTKDREFKQIVFYKESGSATTYTSIKTNLTPFEFQDVLHSLHSEHPGDEPLLHMLQTLHTALKGTTLEIRELGEVDAHHRNKVRYNVREKHFDIIAKLRKAYFDLPHVKNQQQLPDLRVFDDVEEADLAFGFLKNANSYNYNTTLISDPKCGYYRGSFTNEQNKAQLQKFLEEAKVNNPDDPESLKRCAEGFIERLLKDGNDLNHKRVLEVGFGTGVNLTAMRKAFPGVELFGVEPGENYSDAVKAQDGRITSENLRNIKVQDVPKEWLHSFDVVVIPLYHIPNEEREAVWNTISKLVKPNGKIIISALDMIYADVRYANSSQISIVPEIKRQFASVNHGEVRPREMNSYFITCERPTRLKSYVIPGMNEARRQVIEELGGIISTEEDGAVKVLFHPEQLTEAKCEVLGINYEDVKRDIPEPEVQPIQAKTVDRGMDEFDDPMWWDSPFTKKTPTEALARLKEAQKRFVLGGRYADPEMYAELAKTIAEAEKDCASVLSQGQPARREPRPMFPAPNPADVPDHLLELMAMVEGIERSLSGGLPLGNRDEPDMFADILADTQKLKKEITSHLSPQGKSLTNPKTDIVAGDIHKDPGLQDLLAYGRWVKGGMKGKPPFSSTHKRFQDELVAEGKIIDREHDFTDVGCLQRGASENVALLKAQGIDLNGKKVLDVGSGNGINALTIRKAFPGMDYYGVEPVKLFFDLVPQYFQVGGEKIAKGHLHNIPVQEADPSWYYSFDVVMIFLYAVPEDEKEVVWEAVSKLVKPSGQILIGCLEDDYLNRNNRKEPGSILAEIEKQFSATQHGEYKPEYMNRYFTICERPTRLRSYTIPALDDARRKLIAELGGIIESTDANGTAQVLFHPEQLIKEKRELLGIERKGLRGYEEEQIRFIQERIPGAVIEPSPKDKKLQLVTYIPNEQNNRVLEQARSLKETKKQEAAAITIQKIWRGHVGRKEAAERKELNKQLVDSVNWPSVTLATPIAIDLEQLRAGVYVHPNLAVKLGQVKDNPLATSLFFKTQDGKTKQIVFCKESESATTYTAVKTNLTPFEFQDVLHSLHSNLPGDEPLLHMLQTFHTALKGTKLEIRELGEDDSLYRNNVRFFVREGCYEFIPDMRKIYFDLEHVKNQQQLPDLRVFGSLEEADLALDFLKGAKSHDDVVNNPEITKKQHRFMGSFAPEQKRKILEENRVNIARLAPSNTENLVRGAEENIKRLKKLKINLDEKRVLEVGFGTGVNLKAMKDAFPTCMLYGVEPLKDEYSGLSARMATLLSADHIRYTKVQDVPKEWLHSFDVVVIPLYNIPVRQREEAWEIIPKLIKPNGKVLVGCVDMVLADRRYVDNSPFTIIPNMEQQFSVTQETDYNPNYMNRYFFKCERPTRLRSYTIPAMNQDRWQTVEELGGIVERENTDGSVNIWFHPEQLVKDIRKSLGIDRKGLTGYSEEQIRFIQKRIPDAVIEPSPSNKDQQWITFIPTKRNNKVLEQAKSLESIKETVATTIQKNWRGHIGRKEVNTLKEKRNHQWAECVERLGLPTELKELSFTKRKEMQKALAGKEPDRMIKH